MIKFQNTGQIRSIQKRDITNDKGQTFSAYLLRVLINDEVYEIWETNEDAIAILQKLLMKEELFNFTLIVQNGRLKLKFDTTI